MRGLIGVILSTLLAVIAGSARAAGPEVDFDRQIRPIFAEQCIACHGPEKQKGGLRLDVKELALDGGTTGKSILPGKGEKSLLVERLRGHGDDDQMPLKKDPLPEAQIALISRWIDEGAKWPDGGQAIAAAKHWSFIPPARAKEPAVKNAGWVRQPIDRFVLARLESEGMKPSPEAAKETLLRRVSLDLTGLPPSPKELDALLADTSSDAYEKAVDRLLASPHYGERWARHWLDGARYADSNGYSIDSPRSMWPYRDWVINALNNDMPFDEFTIEQLAGDLLPNATIEQKVATGFHRNTQINEEGGIDLEQFRVEAVVDRVGTTGSVFLGLTVGCAQCHNHKFDPISQREYYRLFAFFNSCDEPKLTVPASNDEEHLAEVRERMKALEGEFKTYRENAGSKVADWEDELTAAQKAKLDAAARSALKTPAAKRNAKQKAAVVEAYLSFDAEYVRKQQEYIALKPEAEGVTTLVMAERPEPRESFIFIKGDFTRHADPVTPGTPAVLPPLKAEKPTRLDLAKWIVDPANPLTARVRHAGEQADESGIARLAGDGVRASALEPEGDAPADRHVGHLPPVVARHAGLAGERPVQQTAGPPVARAAGCGSGARCGAGRQRIVLGQSRRPERLPAAAGWRFHGAGEARVEDERRRGSVSTGFVYLGLASHAASAAHVVRRAGPDAHVHAAEPVEHAAPGADSLERCGVRRIRAGVDESCDARGAIR
jgi:mono/diheme cytochrome c family protein